MMMFAIRKIKTSADEADMFFAKIGKGDEGFVIFGLPALWHHRSAGESLIETLQAFTEYKFEVVELVVK